MEEPEGGTPRDSDGRRTVRPDRSRVAAALDGARVAALAAAKDDPAWRERYEMDDDYQLPRGVCACCGIGMGDFGRRYCWPCWNTRKRGRTCHVDVGR